MQILFEYPTNCYDHTSGPHHILVHLFENLSLGDARFREETVLLGRINMTGKRLHPILAILALSKAQGLDSLIFDDIFSHESLKRILEIAKSVKKNPGSILSLLTDIANQQRLRPCEAEEIGLIMEAIRQTMVFTGVEPVAHLAHPLVEALCEMKEAMLRDELGTAKARIIMAAHIDRTCHILLTRASRVVISSRSHLRMLSCVRGSASTQPASGWLTMDVGV